MKKLLKTLIFLVSACNFLGSSCGSGSQSVCPPSISRIKWGAKEPREVEPIAHPIVNVIVHHTVTADCHTESDCIIILKNMQEYHVTKKDFPDIGYNFLVGGDGQIYEGTGWYDKGAHTLGYNTISLGLALIGTFNEELPSERQLEAAKDFLQCAEDLLLLGEDYKLFGATQVRNTDSPGSKLYEDLQRWPHFTTSPPKLIHKMS